MNTLPPRRGYHRKRISALRLSTDSATVPILPRYTSPPWQGPVELIDDPADLPPEYPSSAEEADADSEDESSLIYNPPLPPLTFTPRRARRTKGSSRGRKQTSSNDLDSLLQRSVHALEMSNVLLQSSMSTQSALNNVLTSHHAEDTDVTLEAHARTLSSKITAKNTWSDELDEISRGVEGLFASDDADEEQEGLGVTQESISKSLPATSSLSNFSNRMKRTHLRRPPSLDLRNATLQYTSHDRDDLIAPPPRALTMYVDTTVEPDAIVLPSTLGRRTPTRTQSTPIPVVTGRQPLLLHATGSESSPPSKSAMDVLSSFISRRAGSSKPSSDPDSRTASPSSSFRNRPRSGSASTSTTTTATRKAFSPPAIQTSRSASHSPCRSAPRRPVWEGPPPIIELPSASSSSSSEDLHVDRTLSSLRTILQNNPPPPPQPKPVPDFLKPPSVEPLADTSHATASVSRLFTRARHTTSTRAPSPPRVSAMKGRSGRSAPPTPASPTLSLSSSWMSISDAVGLGSGRSTPNRVSFIEPPDTAGKDKDKTLRRSRSRSRTRKGKSRGKAGDESDTEGGKWWKWLLSPPVGDGSVAPAYKTEERAKSVGWGSRNSIGGSIEEWGV